MEKYEQELNGKTVMIVDFDEIPELPVYGPARSRRMYNRIVDAFSTHGMSLAQMTRAAVGIKTKEDHYAEALTLAIETGIVSGPGKYAIWLSPDLSRYEIYGVFE